MEILLKFDIYSFFSGSKQLEKYNLERYSKLHFLPQVSCQIEFIIICWIYLLLAPPDDVLSKMSDLGHYFNRKKRFENNFLNTPIGGLKLNH